MLILGGYNARLFWPNANVLEGLSYALLAKISIRGIKLQLKRMTSVIKNQPTLPFLRSVVDEMCSLILSQMDQIQSHRYEITWKPDGSPVTNSDVLIENLIHGFLREKFPGIAFAGEESYSQTDAAHEEGYYAILDPIDGTENFCSGLKIWGVSFTLWHSRKHLISLLFLPELGDRLMTGDVIRPVHSRINGFSSSMCQEILDGMGDAEESRLMGCAVFNMYSVITGSFARFSNPRGAYAWDLLPGLILALEHCCEVHVDGKPYQGHFLEPSGRYRVDIRHRYDLHSR
ncbi:inositol monophosphatase family protein [Synechococcus sp. UW105]|uniref:inositol monophosphatase family protein n=1 Tax=Synechococcus sp. UW105 TaxID=337067 RepID=UPI000E0E8BAA|nr:inositol monophosphatase family protein [Synechococcus sp. UW105]